MYDIDIVEKIYKIYLIVLLPILAVNVICLWKIFIKAGYPGWYSIIPVYGYFILLRIINKPEWWIVMMIIPILNIIYTVWIINLLVKKFRKDELFTLGMIFLPIIFYPILAHPETKFYNNENGEDGILEELKEEERISLKRQLSSSLIIALVILFFHSFLWLLFFNFVRDWYNYEGFRSCLDLIFPISLAFFGLASSGRNKIPGIVLAGCIIYLNMISQILLLFRTLLEPYQF